MWVGNWCKAQTIWVADTFTKQEVGRDIRFFSCDKNAYAVQQVIADSHLVWQTNHADMLLLKESEYLHDVWMRFEIVNCSHHAQELYLDINNSLINNLTFYNTKVGVLIDKQIAGDALPANLRSMRYRSFLFPVVIQPNDTHRILLKLDMDGRRFHVPMILESGRSMLQRVAKKDLWLGIYYGVLLFIAAFFLYLYFLLKEDVFWYYALYAASHAFLQLAISGVANVYLWPWASFWSDRSVSFFMSISIVFGLAFVVAFIQVSKFKKWVVHVVHGFQILAFALALFSLASLSLYNASVWILYQIIPLFYLTMFLVAFSFFINRFVPARFFLLGYIGAIISISGIYYYVYTGKHENVFTNNWVVGGELIKSVVLSIAILDRLKLFKEEKERMQSELILQLEQLNQYKQTVNDALEKTVRQKSEEIQQKQQEVKLALIEGEENERKRLAMELHDGMGGLLSTLRLNAESIDLSNKQLDDKEVEAYQNVLQMIDKACSELRVISHNMLPVGIEHFGLETTLRGLLSKMNKTSETHFEFIVTGNPLPDNKTLQLHLYRMMLELINNTLKHAVAKNAIIQLVCDKHTLILMLEDDGVGFDAEAKKQEGLGLLSLQSRVDALNGHLQFDSSPNAGTTVTIEIPI
jgi:signal transduction histidine kinase